MNSPIASLAASSRPIWLPKSVEAMPRKPSLGQRCASVPKLTQVGEERILTALERTVLKELGNLTP